MAKPATPEAYQLLHTGSLALANVEANGFAVDREYLENAHIRTIKRIESLDGKLKRHKIWKEWKRLYKGKAKLTARNQLMGTLIAAGIAKNVSITAKGNISGDKEVLEKIDHPFVRMYLKAEKLKKLENTYIKGLKREVSDDGKVHSFFNLHLVTSHRGSADSPNLQNIPIRDDLVAEVIRKAFVPRSPDRQIVEIDFSGIEVRVAACYNKDPKLIDYLNGKGDMHRDAAADLFLCDGSQVSKMMRYCAKNQYVFPQFYGSYYKQCAPHLWESIYRFDLRVDGIGAKDWLRKKGITELGECDPDMSARTGTFEKNVANCEDRMWKERFRVYNNWKQSWYDKYLRKGYLGYKTGFVIDCLLNRKEASNWPIQGSAFHCLLWSLIQIDRMTRKRGIDALVVSQVHDSIIADVHKDHVNDYIELAVDVMTRKVPKHYKWINVPLEVEAEVSPPGKSWFHKKEYQL